MGIVTSGTGTGTGTAVKLPSLKLIDGAISTSRDSSAGISMKVCNQEVMLDIASSLEAYVNQHCLALLKSSYATNGLQGFELSIRPHSSRMNVAPVAVVAAHYHSLSYPTFDKKFSPCPPLDRGSKSSELLLLNVATAAAAAAAAAAGTSDLKTSPPSTALSASAEAERKSAKMIEMAKKVAALKARQQKGIGSSL